MKRLRDCWNCEEAQDMDEAAGLCPNCGVPNPCGVPNTFPAHICRHGMADRSCRQCFPVPQPAEPK